MATEPVSGDPEEMDLAELVRKVLWDGVVAAIAGAGGNVAVMGTLLLAALLGGFSIDSFAVTAEIVGLGTVLPDDQLVAAGIVIFVGGGLTTWPLLLATLGAYLPGEGSAAKGLFFGFVMWTGFAFGFYEGYTGVSLVIYLVAGLVGHLGYGYVTGALLDRLFSAENRPVIAARIDAPATGTEPSADPNAETPPGGVGRTVPDESDRDTHPVGGPGDPTTTAGGTNGAGTAGGSTAGTEQTNGAAADANASDSEAATNGTSTGAVAEGAQSAGDDASGDDVVPTTTDAGQIGGPSRMERLAALDEDAEGVPPLLRFKQALTEIDDRLDEHPSAFERVVDDYLELAYGSGTPHHQVSDLSLHVTTLKDSLPDERTLQRWVDSMDTRTSQYLKTHDTSETLHLVRIQFYEDGEPVESVAELQSELAEVEATVQNQGGRSGAVVRLEFRRHGDTEPGQDPEEVPSILLRSDNLSMGEIAPGKRKTLRTKVYVPSIAEWCDATALDPQEGQTFLTDVEEVRND